MQSTGNAAGLIDAGAEALRRGDAHGAREAFERAIAQGATPPPWLGVAQACRMVGDRAGEEQAIEAQLALDSRHVPALLLMGDVKARAGDLRAASSYFRLGLGQLAAGGPPPAMLAPLVQRAQAFLREAAAEYEAHLAACIEQSGLALGRGGARVRQSVDLLLGRSEIYLQQPTTFYFPGLPQRQFFEREEFDWLAPIEAAIPAMRGELDALLAAEAEFAPYIEREPNRPTSHHPLLDDPRWGAFYFWQAGERIEANAARCPATMEALRHAPMPRISGRSPIAHYSLLKPGTHLRPHNGMLNTRLICHIPLLLPGDCALRVGSETRAWAEGEALVFDDSIEHEAWNRSDKTRIILLFEIWRPELSAEERAALTAIFEAIDLYGAGA